MSVLGGASVSQSPSSALWDGQGLSLSHHSATGRGRMGTSAITPLWGMMMRAQGRPLNAQTIFEVTIPSTTNPAHHQGPRVCPDGHPLASASLLMGPRISPTSTCVSSYLNPLEHAFSVGEEGITPKGAKTGSWVGKKKVDITMVCGPPKLNPI